MDTGKLGKIEHKIKDESIDEVVDRKGNKPTC